MKKFNNQEFYNQIKSPLYFNMGIKVNDNEQVQLFLSEGEGEESFIVGLSGAVIEDNIFDDIKDEFVLLKTTFPERSITYKQLKEIMERENSKGFAVVLESENDELIFPFALDQESKIIQFGSKKYLFSNKVINF